MTLTLPGTKRLDDLMRMTQDDGIRTTLSKAIQVLRGRWYLRNTQSGLVRVRGRVKVTNRGMIRLGDRLRLDGTLVPIELVSFGGRLTVGDGTYINYGTNISSTCAVTIGKNCLIGQYSIIMDDDYHAVDDHSKPGLRAPIVIADDVWLGARVIVLRGSQIGRGAVIGANSVVKGTIPPFTVAAGMPARVVRELPHRD